MANVTNISVLDSTNTTATVSTLDAFRSNIGTSALSVVNATASLLNATITGTAALSGTITSAITGSVTVANATASLLFATVTGVVGLGGVTAGGLLLSSTLATATTNLTVVKGSAGQVYVVAATNNNSAIAYLKFYDNTTVSAGSGTPVWRLMIPTNTGGAGIVENIGPGLAFTNGICFATTSGIADTDTSVVASSSLLINVGYK